jgi:hypothetical protein
MFSKATIYFSTDATGDVDVDVGFEAYVPPRRSGECAQLEGICEVSIDGAPWVSFEELQASGLRTLAHEIVLELDDKMYDLDGQLCDELAADEEDRCNEMHSDRY